MKMKAITKLTALLAAICGLQVFGAVGDTVTYSNTNLVGTTGIEVTSASYGPYQLLIPATDALPTGSVLQIESITLGGTASAAPDKNVIGAGAANLAYLGSTNKTSSTTANFGGVMSSTYKCPEACRVTVGTAITCYALNQAGGGATGNTMTLSAVNSTEGGVLKQTNADADTKRILFEIKAKVVSIAAGTKVISVNLQSAKASGGAMASQTFCYGLESVPGSAWTDDGLQLANNNAGYDSDVSVDIKQYDRTTSQTTTLSGVTLHEKVNNAFYWTDATDPFLKAYADDSARPTITLSGIPYKRYDVIVYAATDTANLYFGPVCVNGTYYKANGNGETISTTGTSSTSDTSWGGSRNTIAKYGKNTLRITKQTASTVTIYGANNANSCRGGIAAFQIVDTSDSVETITPADDGTLTISAAVSDAKKIVFTGAVKIVGTESYTVTDSDLANLLKGDGVTTVTLGAYTLHSIGTERDASKDDYAIVAGATISVTETMAEYGAGSLSVTGLTEGCKVQVVRADGTTSEATAVGATCTFTLTGDPVVSGAACLYDFTFTNTITTAKGSKNTATMSIDGSRTKAYNSDQTGIMAYSAPWISMTGILPAAKVFTTVVVGTVPAAHQKILVSFGSADAGRSLLFLASSSEDNIVDVCYYNGSSIESLAQMNVPNAATCRHMYAFKLSENGTQMQIYLDGVKQKTVSRTAGFTLGNSSHSGIQVGSGFGGSPSPYTGVTDTTETAVFNALLYFDYLITDGQMTALKNKYQYTSPNGTYTRTVSGEVDYVSDGTWTKSGTSDTASEPVESSTADINASDTATITVNSEKSLEALLLSGASMTFKKGTTGPITTASSTISTAVTIEYGSVSLSGGPTTLTENGSLVFDCSNYDLTGVYTSRKVFLTGEIEDQAAGKVTCNLPTGDDDRAVAFSYDSATHQYVMTITPSHEAGSRVYLKSDATEVTDTTKVLTESAGTTEVNIFQGDILVINHAQTVQFNHTASLLGGISIEGGVTVLVNNGTDNYALNGETVTIDNGTLKLNNGDQDAKINSATINISQNGNLDNCGWLTVDGTLSVNSGYTKTILSNTGNNASKIRGTGTLAFAGGGVLTMASLFDGAHPINVTGTTKLVFSANEYTTGAISGNGTISIPSGATITLPTIEANLTGAGTLKPSTYPTTTTKPASFTDWTGTVEFPATTEDKGDFSTLLNAWGVSGSTIVLNSVGTSGSKTTGKGTYINGSTTINPKVVLAADATVILNNGNSNTTGVFSELSGAGALSIQWTGTYNQKITKLTDFTGSLAITTEGRTITVDEMDVDTLPAVNSKLLSTTTGARVTITAVKVGEAEAAAVPLQVRTDGLYVTLASSDIKATIGQDVYSTVQAAIDVVNAEGSGKTLADITVTEGAEIPSDYGLNSSGKLVVKADQVAKIGEVYYTALADALTAASSETATTITVLKAVSGDVAIEKNLILSEGSTYLTDANITVASGKTLTLAFNGTDGNKTFKVEGADTTATVKLAPTAGIGLLKASSFKDITVEVTGSGYNLWFGTDISTENVNLVLDENSTIKIEHTGTLVVNTLTGKGTLDQDKYDETTGGQDCVPKLQISQSCAFEGTVSAPIVLAAGASLTLNSESDNVSAVEGYHVKHTISEDKQVYTATDKYTVTFTGKDVVFSATDGTAFGSEYEMAPGELSFKATIEGDYEIETVKADGTALEPTEGVYTTTISADTAISATTVHLVYYKSGYINVKDAVLAATVVTSTGGTATYAEGDIIVIGSQATQNPAWVGPFTAQAIRVEKDFTFGYTGDASANLKGVNLAIAKNCKVTLNSDDYNHGRKLDSCTISGEGALFISDGAAVTVVSSTIADTVILAVSDNYTLVTTTCDTSTIYTSTLKTNPTVVVPSGTTEVTTTPVKTITYSGAAPTTIKIEIPHSDGESAAIDVTKYYTKDTSTSGTITLSLDTDATSKNCVTPTGATMAMTGTTDTGVTMTPGNVKAGFYYGLCVVSGPGTDATVTTDGVTFQQATSDGESLSLSNTTEFSGTDKVKYYRVILRDSAQ